MARGNPKGLNQVLCLMTGLSCELCHVISHGKICGYLKILPFSFFEAWQKLFKEECID